MGHSVYGQGDYQKIYDTLKAAKQIGLGEEQRLGESRQHGWIFAAVFDPTFTPEKAKQMQQALTGLRARYSRDNPDQFAEIATNLLQPYDRQLRYRAEVAAGLRQLRDALTVELTAAIERADKLNDVMLRAAEADINVAKTLGTIAGSEEAKQLFERLAANHIGNEQVRNAVVNLFNDLAGSINN